MSLYDRIFGRDASGVDAPELDAEQVRLIQMSFQKLSPNAAYAAQKFYQRLFEIAPEVRPLFAGEPGTAAMDPQGRKLMAALGMIVMNLGTLGTVIPVARQMAVRHVNYGVKAEHYSQVGAALLWTLEDTFGNEFTPAHRIAWERAYTALSNVMIEAAYPEDTS